MDAIFYFIQLRREMINTPDKSEMTTDNEQTPSKDELLNNLQKDTKQFSRKVNFSGLDYDARREKVDDMTDELIDLLHKERLDRRNIFMNLLMEIIKNSADHSQSDTDIHLQITRDNQTKKATITFAITDESSGFPFTEEEFMEMFCTNGISKEKWIKKGKQNCGIGLGIIDSVIKALDVDLILHNKGKAIHLHDVKLQNLQNKKYTFGYEGVGIFDMME